MVKVIVLSVACAMISGIAAFVISGFLNRRSELHAYSDGYRDAYRKYGVQRCPDVSAHETIMDQEIMIRRVEAGRTPIQLDQEIIMDQGIMIRRDDEAGWTPIQSHHGDGLSPMHEHEALTDEPPPEASFAELRRFIAEAMA